VITQIPVGVNPFRVGVDPLTNRFWDQMTNCSICSFFFVLSLMGMCLDPY
jgi:hypothetical protein